MKVLIGLCILLASVTAQATPPEYYSSRQWVEDRATNQVPKEERIFVGRLMPADQADYAAIMRFHKGVTLREVIDQTPFKGTNLCICILRAGDRRPGRLIRVGSAENPDFELKDLDMIWLYKEGPVLW